MDKGDVLPPGQHPRDTRRPDVDQVGHALERLQTFLLWIDEHRASFENERSADGGSADAELRNLQDSTEQAALHLQRLTELLLAGYAMDPGKVPMGLSNERWARWVQLLLQ